MMLSRRTGEPIGCSAPICAVRGCRGCGDGLGLHIGAVGRGETHLQIEGLFPRRYIVTQQHAFVAETGEAADPRVVHEEMRRFGFRILRREYYLWDTLLWVWDGERITLHTDRLDMAHFRAGVQPGVEVVRAAERSAA